MSLPDDFEVRVGDALAELEKLPNGCVQTCVTSPPYWGLRDYGVDGQLGLEPTPEQYVEKLVAVFREVRRVLRDDGTLWLNLGDSYAGSWGAQSRGGPPSDKGTLRGNGHLGGGPKVNDLSEVHVRAAPKRESGTGSTVDLDLKPKDLVGIPWRVAFALQQDGWWLRSDIIWHKPNPMPESVTDRPTKAHEYVFLLSKSERYFYDHEAIKEGFRTADHENYPDRSKPLERGRNKTVRARAVGGGNEDRGNSGGYPPDGSGRNKRSVWTVTTKPFPDAHFAVYPPDLIVPCIKAGSAKRDLVLDPFCGAGTTGVVCTELGRRFLGIELNDEYAEMARKRIMDTNPSLFRETA